MGHIPVMSHILVIPCYGDSSLTTQPSLLASSWSVKTKVDSKLCSGLYIHTDVHTCTHTENNLASGLVILADCCSDPIFSLVPITTAIILIYMCDGGPDFLSKVSCVMSTFMKAGWPLLETCH